MKVLLFDIDGTLVRAGGAGRKALNGAAFRLYGKRDACSELSLAGRTDLWNFRQAFRSAKGRAPSARELERLHSRQARCVPAHIRHSRTGRDSCP